MTDLYNTFFPSSMPKMSDRDSMILSPWEKWVKYKRFPVKIVLQVLVLLVLLAHVYVISQYPASALANLKAFREYFLPEDGGVWTLEDCLAQLNKTVEVYYSINSMTITNVSYDGPPGDPSPVLLVLQDVSDDSGANLKYYNQTLEDPLGPFSGDAASAKAKISSLSSITQSFFLMDTAYIRGVGIVTSRWHVTITYEIVGSWVDVGLDLGRTFPANAVFQKEGWISIALFILATLSALLSLKRIIMGFMVYRRSRREFNNISKDKLMAYFETTRVTPMCLEWSKIPFDIKFEFLSSWHMWSICGDILIAVSQVLRLCAGLAGESGEELLLWSRLCTGVGVLILCTNMMKYLEYSIKFYTLILTLKASAKRILRLVFSTLPMFFGYILCGVIVFSPYSELFSSMDNAGVILFSLLNGDDIHATFSDLQDNYPLKFFARVYLYSFVALFITAILNMFIFIIEDSYELAKVLSGDIHRSGEESLDYDEMLLWENLQLEFGLRHLFDILEANDPKKSNHVDENEPLIPGNTSSINAKDKSDAREISKKHSANNHKDDDDDEEATGDSEKAPLIPHTPKTPATRGQTPREPFLGGGLPKRKREITVEKMEAIMRKHQGRFLNDAKRGLLLTQTRFLEAIAQDVEEYLKKNE